MKTELEKHSDLWTEKERFLLILLNKTPSNENKDPVIFDARDGGVIIIEDDDIYRGVVKKMRAAGVREVSEMPEAGVFERAKPKCSG